MVVVVVQRFNGVLSTAFCNSMNVSTYELFLSPLQLIFIPCRRLVSDRDLSFVHAVPTASSNQVPMTAGYLTFRYGYSGACSLKKESLWHPSNREDEISHRGSDCRGLTGLGMPSPPWLINAQEDFGLRARSQRLASGDLYGLSVHDDVLLSATTPTANRCAFLTTSKSFHDVLLSSITFLFSLLSRSSLTTSFHFLTTAAARGLPLLAPPVSPILFMASTNTDEVFEADVNAQVRTDARARSRSQKTRRESQSKEPTTEFVDNSTHRKSPPPYEHTPLLERDPDDQDNTGDGSSDHGSRRSAPDWSGARDFEGRPWWRKPSVSEWKHLLGRQLGLTRSRSSGSYRHSCWPHWPLAVSSSPK